jgi:hypothetical protein
MELHTQRLRRKGPMTDPASCIQVATYSERVDEDWRLTGQESYLRGRALRFARWTSYRPGWDHDHCDFCFAEISGDTTGHADYNEAWVTATDGYTWVCPECFNDFRKRFRWHVVEM